jgi:hypothetical protein
LPKLHVAANVQVAVARLRLTTHVFGDVFFWHAAEPVITKGTLTETG